MKLEVILKKNLKVHGSNKKIGTVYHEKSSCAEENDRNVYLCFTYYHLLISIIKKIKNKEKEDLILISPPKNNYLTKNEKLIKRLKNANIFENIYIYDLSYEINGIKHFFNFLKKIKETKRKIKTKEYDLKKYRNVYVYNDYGIIGYILNKQRIKYHLLEDGMDCYKNKNLSVFKKRQKRDKLIKKILKKIYHFSDAGFSKSIKSIEVNDKTDLYLKNKNIIELSKKKLFSSLKEKEKTIITYIFINDKKELKIKKNVLLLLTQPLDIDKLVDSEETKIEIYKKIISDYSNNNNIIIKPHPRETTDYKKIFKNVEVIDRYFPVELLNFFENEIEVAITIFSTAIDIINCKKKIELGYEYINKLGGNR